MKKILALLLALALCVGLCACGQEKAPESAASGDGSAATIAKPAAPAATEAPKAETPATEAPVKEAPPKEAPPAETPAPTTEPAPAAEIEIDDLCAIAGTHAVETGYNEYYSFVLPYVTAPDSPYIHRLNDEMVTIYDEYVEGSLETLEEYEYLPHTCVSYLYAENNGIHSLLVTCDSDWGDEQYWCYNFDDEGNEVKNSDILKAAGQTEKSFLAAAKDYLTDYTDLSEYLDDDEFWKPLQEQTIAEDNLNADLPMVLLPDGNLCFICTVYTPAGAGEYRNALEFTGKKQIETASTGTIMMNRLVGTYVVSGPDAGLEDDSISYLIEFFTVGDSLMAEITGFDQESGSAMYYYGADIIPYDPADLYRADIDSMDVSILTWCPDVFAGSYYGDPADYTLTVGKNSVSFTDFGGGTPILGTGDDFTAEYAYRDDIGVDDPVPGPDYDKVDFDAMEASGLPGIWTGHYTDYDYNTHSLTIEMTYWGGMILRDTVDGRIPRVLHGSYYIAQEGDDMAPEAGMVVFNLVSRGGYKMPVMGYCDMTLEDGLLLIDEENDSYGKLTDVDAEAYYCILNRVPAVRYFGASQIVKLDENETFTIDIDADGTEEALSYYFTYENESTKDTITGITFVVNGEETEMTDQWFYGADVYLAEPMYSGQVFFYVDAQSDNDYHYTQVIGVSADDVWYAGDYFGGFDGEPEDTEWMNMFTRLHILSTTDGVRAYRVGQNGLPEAVEPYFYAADDITLTAKQDIDAWFVDLESGELIEPMTLSAGTEVTFLCSDGSTFWDLLTEDDECYRVWVNRGDGAQTIGGVDIEDCFEGVRFAG